MLLLLIFFIIGVAGSIFFSGAETGFITWNILKIRHRAFKGDIVARWGLFMVKRRDQLIATILIGNNVANIGTSLAFVTIIELLLPYLPAFFSKIPSPESWILTPFLLLIGEMLPKSLFRMYPFRLTMKTTPIMACFFILFYPITRLFALFTNRKKGTTESIQTTYSARVREEMVLIASEGSKTGSLFRSADQFMEGALLFNEKKIGDIVKECTLNIHTIPYGTCVGEIKKNIEQYSEIALIKNNDPKKNGYVRLIDVISASNDMPIEKMMKGFKKISESETISSALRTMKLEAHTLAEVISEEGKVVGIVDSIGIIKSIFQNIKSDTL